MFCCKTVNKKINFFVFNHVFCAIRVDCSHNFPVWPGMFYCKEQQHILLCCGQEKNPFLICLHLIVQNGKSETFRVTQVFRSFSCVSISPDHPDVSTP